MPIIVFSILGAGRDRDTSCAGRGTSPLSADDRAWAGPSLAPASGGAGRDRPRKADRGGRHGNHDIRHERTQAPHAGRDRSRSSRSCRGCAPGALRPALLDHVQVEAYGNHMPLNQLATISVPEPRLLNVQVWDRSMVHAVEKAISAANLGLTPSTEGQVLRLRIPELNEERRQGDRQGRAQIRRSCARRGASRSSRRPRSPQEAGEGSQDQRGRAQLAKPARCRKRPTRRSPMSRNCLPARKRRS